MKQKQKNGHIDLHRHIEGSVRPNTIFELLDKNSEYKDLEYLESEMIVRSREPDLMSFIGKLGTRFMKMVTKGKDEIAMFSFEAFEDAYFDGVTYLELRICPAAHERENLSFEDILIATYEGFLMAKKLYGIEGGVISSLKREDPMEKNIQIVKISEKLFKRGYVARIDICGNETAYPRYELMDTLHKINMPKTIHAGEAGPPENILYAIRSGATRIGHGTQILKSKEAIDLVRRKNIVIEVCITSNILTGAVDCAENHPVFHFDALGIPYTLCSDDPITQGIRLSDEIALFNSIKRRRELEVRTKEPLLLLK